VTEGKIPFKVEHEWTGIMGYSMDGLPLVGPLTPLGPLQGKTIITTTTTTTSIHGLTVRRSRHCPLQDGVRAGQYIGAGYTGNGMANCFAAAKALADMISGQLQPEVILIPPSSSSTRSSSSPLLVRRRRSIARRRLQDFVQCLLPSRFFDDAKRREIELQAEEDGDW
jgi:glycine/D-amino acid oxidase-like deaminating enzyme